MWIFTTVGYFSITKDTRKDADPNSLQVRTRFRKDLDMLRSTFLPELTKTIELPNRDYPYRGYCTKEQLAAAMVGISMAIDYSNFKSQITKVQGLAREQIYAQVWGVLHDGEAKEKKNEEKNRAWNVQNEGWKSWYEKNGGSTTTSTSDKKWYSKQGSLFDKNGGVKKAKNANSDSDKPDASLYPEDKRDPFDHDSGLDAIDVWNKNVDRWGQNVGDGPDMDTSGFGWNAPPRHNKFDNIELSDDEISKLSDDDFAEYIESRGVDDMIPEGVALPFAADPYQTDQSDDDFLKMCAREAAEEMAAREERAARENKHPGGGHHRKFGKKHRKGHK